MQIEIPAPTLDEFVALRDSVLELALRVATLAGALALFGSVGSDGLRWTGVVTLVPVTAMILHNGEPSGPIVLTQ